MISKVYELVCDNPNCGWAMNHLTGSLASVKEQAKDFGHVVKGNKIYCDDECYRTRKEKND